MFQIIRRKEEIKKNAAAIRKATAASIRGDGDAHFVLLYLLEKDFEIRRSPAIQIIFKKS